MRQDERKQYACDYDDCVKFVKLKLVDRRERLKQRTCVSSRVESKTWTLHTETFNKHSKQGEYTTMEESCRMDRVGGGVQINRKLI